MRSIDLALYADRLAAEAATLAARLERARARLRNAAIEHEARLGLPPEVVVQLERLGVLSARCADGVGGEIVEIQAALSALEALQAWVERQLAASRAPPSSGMSVVDEPVAEELTMTG